MKLYLNGSFVDEKDAKVSVFDSGFLYGDGLFETMRAYNGAIFALDRHLERLAYSAGVLEYDNMPAKETLMDACSGILRVNELKDARIRLTITRGMPEAASPTVLIAANSYAGYDPDLYEKGMCAITLPGYRFSNSLLSVLKTTSYLSSILARKEAAAAGCQEAILINEKSHLTEGSISNIFAVKSGAIITPRISDGLLAGITRELVIELAIEANYVLEQQNIHTDELFELDELFLTNSLMEVMPVTTVNENPIGEGKPGPITRDLAQRYKELVSAKAAAV